METSLLDPVDIALAEDVGTGDLTSLFFIPETRVSKGRIFAKEACVIAGVDVVQRIYRKLDPRMELSDFETGWICRGTRRNGDRVDPV